MKSNTLTLGSRDYPSSLSGLRNVPKRLYVLGDIQILLSLPTLGIVGSRRLSPYGRATTSKLAADAARQGIVIVSGLAIGADALAHLAAIEAGGKTIAVLPGSLEKIYPSSHTQLARRILESGGALVSEYAPGSRVYKGNFIARNRIIAGLSQGLLVTEAARGSGSLHTARFARDLGRPVMAVPGNITSPTAAGTNDLLYEGATLVRNAIDIYDALGIPVQANNSNPYAGATPAEQAVLRHIDAGHRQSDELQQLSGLEAGTYAQTLTMLELNGIIRNDGTNTWVRV